MNRISEPKKGFAGRQRAIVYGAHVFRTLVGSPERSLWAFSQHFSMRVNNMLRLGETVWEDIELFAQAWKGIFLINHLSGNLHDYLTFFAHIPESILEKTTFYTGSYNLAMNQDQFPKYRFRAADLEGGMHPQDLGNQVREDMHSVESEGGYIFIVPSGATTDPWAPFRAVFQRMIRHAHSDLPVLNGRISICQREPLGYWELAKTMILSRFWASTQHPISLSTHFGSAAMYKNRTAQEMRDIWADIMAL